MKFTPGANVIKLFGSLFMPLLAYFIKILTEVVLIVALNVYEIVTSSQCLKAFWGFIYATVGIFTSHFV
jgi:hypothetical protein